jgi:hypothetical protein
MTISTDGVIKKIDELLTDDKNFTTRTGLRFMTVVMKEALEVIGEADEKKHSFNIRLTHIENGLNEFLILQEKKEKKAEEERGKWRWAIFSPMIVILLGELARWIFK